MNSYKILKKPLMSEKSSSLQESANTYTFIVDSKSNRINIKKAIEEYFKVVVEKVRVLNIAPKQVMRRSMQQRKIIKGYTSSYKKAYITLRKGESIELYET